MQISCLNTHTCLFIGQESFNLKQCFNRMVFTYVNIINSIAYDFSPKIFFFGTTEFHMPLSQPMDYKNMQCSYDTYLPYSYILL